MSRSIKADIFKTSVLPQYDLFAVEMLSYDTVLKNFNFPEYTVLPGFCDVHVHFREPGFFYKESIATGCMAAAHGGTRRCVPCPISARCRTPRNICGNNWI